MQSDKALISLEEATTSLKQQSFHPSRELAITLVGAAHHALLTARENGDTAVAHEVRKQLKTIEDWFKLQRARLIESNFIVAERLRAERVIGEASKNGGKSKGGRPAKNSLNDFTSFQRLCKELGVSRPTLTAWERESEIIDADFEQWVQGMASEQEISTAALLRLWREFFPGQPETRTPDLPEGIYDLIYADPPWRYEHVETENRAIENQYPTMPIEEICALPISDMAADDCVLFLWATNPKLEEAMRVIEAWGFTYRTNMVWIKDKIGMGYYARQRHELLLIARRGEPPVPAESDRPDSVQEFPRGEHSAKPEAFYEIIERMYPGRTKIELFSRRPREGWKTWGNEM